jgi:hypothetical protein
MLYPPYIYLSDDGKVLSLPPPDTEHFNFDLTSFQRKTQVKGLVIKSSFFGVEV